MIPIRKLNLTIYRPKDTYPMPQVTSYDDVTCTPIFAPVVQPNEFIMGSFNSEKVLDTDRTTGQQKRETKLIGRLDVIPNWMRLGGNFDGVWNQFGRDYQVQLELTMIGESVLGLEDIFGHYCEMRCKWLDQ